MEASRLFRILVGSLRMMEIRGFSIDPFREFVDFYNYLEERNRDRLPIEVDVEPFSDENIAIAIRQINKGTYGFENTLPKSKSKAENFSYIVTNYSSGVRAIVYFCMATSDPLKAGDLSRVADVMQLFSMALNGTTDASSDGSRLKGVIIINGKLGPNPKEKSEVISTLDFISDNVILSNPYDNVMQSQYFKMTASEESAFYSDPSIEPNQIPSMVLDKDQYLRYIGAKKGETRQIIRAKISEEEALDLQMSFRYIK